MARIGKRSLILIFLAASLMAQQQRSPLPELPADIPRDAFLRMGLMDKPPMARTLFWKSPDGTIHGFFQFDDRGRGPSIYTTYRFDARGLIVFEESKGVDYKLVG